MFVLNISFKISRSLLYVTKLLLLKNFSLTSYIDSNSSIKPILIAAEPVQNNQVKTSLSILLPRDRMISDIN